jgi:uncharacterized protein (DUF433 family)
VRREADTGLSGPPDQAGFPIGLAPAWCRGATARIASRRRDLIATRVTRAHSRELEPHGWLVGAGQRPSSRLSPRDGNGLLPLSGAKEFQTWQRLTGRSEAVESIPGKVSGAWVFKGTRLPVATVIENLEDLSIDEVIEQFDVSREQVTAVLEFVAESLRSAVPTGARPV